MSDHGFQLSRVAFGRIGQVDLVVVPIRGDTVRIPLLLCEGIHGLDRCGLIVITADMHALDPQAFVIGEELHWRVIQLLLSGCLTDGPLNIGALNEVWQPLREIHPKSSLCA